MSSYEISQAIFTYVLLILKGSVRNITFLLFGSTEFKSQKTAFCTPADSVSVTAAEVAGRREEGKQILV